MARTKKEIDKELMYKKLMPSGPRAAKTASQDAKSEEPSSSYVKTAVRAIAEEPLNQHKTIMRREVAYRLWTRSQPYW